MMKGVSPFILGSGLSIHLSEIVVSIESGGSPLRRMIWSVSALKLGFHYQRGRESHILMDFRYFPVEEVVRPDS